MKDKNMITDLILALLPVALRSISATRAALAADLRELADSIEQGALIPDEAFAQAKEDLEHTKSVRDRIKDMISRSKPK